jgi:hypothetical protein
VYKLISRTPINNQKESFPSLTFCSTGNDFRCVQLFPQLARKLNFSDEGNDVAQATDEEDEDDDKGDK